MEVRCFPSDLLLSNMYLIVEGDRAIVVDPSRDTAPAAGLTIDRILLTHEHYDHISGVNAWKALTGAPVLCSERCAENIRDARKNMAHLFGAFCELQSWIRLDSIPEYDEAYTCGADETFSDRMEFHWRGHEFRLMEIPGHSLGSIGIQVDDGLFFSGDSLMENSEIELRLPGGSKKLWKAIGEARVSALPEGIRVYPGHFGDFIHNGQKGGCRTIGLPEK